ncbi:ABC-2 family transporter protein [Candidatus Daviesbacteria bacterium]|nr:ABC-2 family transporter protein [Candidatus Daviesbacteria bacterium]
MKKYWVYFKLNFQEMLEYRTDVIIWTLSGAILPLIGLTIWLAVLGSGAKLAYSYPELVTYFILAMTVEILVGAWGAWFISEKINNGDFSVYLIKPVSVLTEYFIQNMSEKIFKIFVIIFVIIGVVLASQGKIAFPLNILNWLLFFTSLLMSILIAFLLDFILGLSAFWFHEIDFFKNYISLSNQLFSGKLIPVAFLPATLFNLAVFLPFRYIISFPIEVLLGKLSAENVVLGFGIQFFWLTFFFLGYKLTYSKGIKLYQGFGG